MSSIHAASERNPTPKFGRQSAKQTLQGIAKAYPGKLAITFSLVGLENALFLAYPLFAGFAVDALVRGDKYQALLYAIVVLGFWVVGSARRAVDTRTFTAIYADMAVPVILGQRRLEQSMSTAAARVVLAREFVDFFERLVPTIATAVISLLGAAAMLRTALSDREAFAYLVIGVVAALLFAIAIWQLANGDNATPGHIYAVMTYLWTFVTCLDEAPSSSIKWRDSGTSVNAWHPASIHLALTSPSA